MQGRGGNSSRKLGDTCKFKDCKAEVEVSRAGRQMQRIARQRRTQQSELGDTCKTKDCKAEADTAAQSWETNKKDCKPKADSSPETNVKDCKRHAARAGRQM